MKEYEICFICCKVKNDTGIWVTPSMDLILILDPIFGFCDKHKPKEEPTE